VTTKEARNRWYHNGGKYSQMLSNKRMLLRNRLAWQHIKAHHPDVAEVIMKETNKQLGGKQ
jgi:hypothetical protein